MTGALIAPNADEFVSLFRSFRHTAYRLETLQSYGSSGEDAVFAAFLDGARYQRHPGKVAWLDTIDRAQAAGCWMGRVHVVTEPLSDYMRFELTWGYQPNVTAGEDIHILPVAEGESWPDLPRYDYWLFDSCELYRMHYADDDAGTWLGVEHVINPAEVVQAGAWRDIAWHHAIPWRDYVRVHPELVEHLPAG